MPVVFGSNRRERQVFESEILDESQPLFAPNIGVCQGWSAVILPLSYGVRVNYRYRGMTVPSGHARCDRRFPPGVSPLKLQHSTARLVAAQDTKGPRVDAANMSSRAHTVTQVVYGGLDEYRCIFECWPDIYGRTGEFCFLIGDATPDCWCQSSHCGPQRLLLERSTQAYLRCS